MVRRPRESPRSPLGIIMSRTRGVRQYMLAGLACLSSKYSNSLLLVAFCTSLDVVTSYSSPCTPHIFNAWITSARPYVSGPSRARRWQNFWSCQGLLALHSLCHQSLSAYLFNNYPQALCIPFPRACHREVSQYSNPA